MEVEGVFVKTVYCVMYFQYSVMVTTCKQYIWNQSRKKLVTLWLMLLIAEQQNLLVLISLYYGNLHYFITSSEVTCDWNCHERKVGVYMQ